MIILATGMGDHDYWKVKIHFGFGVIQNSGYKRCSLTEKDHRKFLTFRLLEDSFYLNMPSASQ